MAGEYRFGFNGKEFDSELSGTGNQYDYGFRIYNPRLGRFLSVDPLSKDYPWYTPYQFAGNKPIAAIDLDGLEEFFVVRWYDSNNQFVFSAAIKVPHDYQIQNQGTIYLELSAANPGDATIFQNLFGITPDKALMQQTTFQPDNNPAFNFSNIIDKNNPTNPFPIGTPEPMRPLEKDMVTKNPVRAKDEPTKGTGAVSAFLYRLPEQTVYFDHDLFNIDAADLEPIKYVSDHVRSYPSLTVTVEGNTSDLATTAYNITLGMRRAESVEAQMSEYGVSTDRITTISNGESRATGTTDETRQLDRNAQIKVNYPSAGN